MCSSPCVCNAMHAAQPPPKYDMRCTFDRSVADSRRMIGARGFRQGIQASRPCRLQRHHACRVIAQSKGVSALVVGSGGREHALVWRLSQSDACKHIFVAPGNPGTATEKNVTNVKINVDNNAEVCMGIWAGAHGTAARHPMSSHGSASAGLSLRWLRLQRRRESASS